MLKTGSYVAMTVCGMCTMLANCQKGLTSVLTNSWRSLDLVGSEEQASQERQLFIRTLVKPFWQLASIVDIPHTLMAT